MDKKDSNAPNDHISPIEFALLAMVIGLIASGIVEGLKYREPAATAGITTPGFVEMHAYDGIRDLPLPEETPR